MEDFTKCKPAVPFTFYLGLAPTQYTNC